DVDLVREQSIAATKSQMQDPSTLSNDVVNEIFYPKGHPYYHSFEQALKELPKIDAKALKENHGKILNAELITLAVAGSLEADEVMKELNKHFGSIKPTVIKRENVPEPSFQKGAPVGFHDLSIPTAYIRIKFNSKSVTDR